VYLSVYTPTFLWAHKSLTKALVEFTKPISSQLAVMLATEEDLFSNAAANVFVIKVQPTPHNQKKFAEKDILLDRHRMENHS